MMMLNICHSPFILFQKNSKRKQTENKRRNCKMLNENIALSLQTFSRVCVFVCNFAFKRKTNILCVL